MESLAVEERRDPRYYLRANHAFVEFDDPAQPDTHWSGRLVGLSAAGINLTIDALPQLEPGTILRDVTLRIGNCRISGSITIKNLKPLDETRLQLGGLFYPGSEMEASRLMALLAGMEAVDWDSGERESAR